MLNLNRQGLERLPVALLYQEQWATNLVIAPVRPPLDRENAAKWIRREWGAFRRPTAFVDVFVSR